MDKLKEIELFLLDMDGTIYLDDTLFDGTLEFITQIINSNKKYIFLTNNSSKSENDYINKLTRLGIPCSKDNIFTSGAATAMYLNEFYPNRNVYLVGTQSLHKELLDNNVNLVEDNPDIVCIGFDRELTYSKLEKACKFLCDGAVFIATNADYVCPIENKRYIPDCASICQMITNATSKKPLFIGKPNPYMINILSSRLNISKEKIAMIGDRVYTDIASGYNANVVTICVLSGESTIETIEASDIKPNYVFNSIKDLINKI